MERWDTIVVGGGAMGTAAARSLAARGRSCLVLERFRVGHDRGSSHGATRIFRLAYHHPMYVRMARAALGEWRELEEEAGERLLVTTGGLDAGPGAEAAAEALGRAGESFGWLGSDEVSERWPGLTPSAGTRLLFQEEAGVCLAARTVAAQARLARAAGATILEETEVTALAPHDYGVEIRTADHSFRGGTAIVAAGAWTPAIAATAGAAFPARVTQEQVLYADRAPTGPLPTLIEWTSPAVYALPDPLTGTTIKVGEHLAGQTVDPDARTFQPDPESVARASRWAATRFPGTTVSRVETCLYTNTADEDFVIDRVGSVVVASPCSGHGFKFAPLVGRLLADLATGAQPPVDVTPFALGRAALRGAPL